LKRRVDPISILQRPAAPGARPLHHSARSEGRLPLITWGPSLVAAIRCSAKAQNSGLRSMPM
jgi:hypothetical protein